MMQIRFWGLHRHLSRALGYSLTHGPYLIPRSDALVLGGTYERGERNTQPRLSDCRRIVRSHQMFFGGWLSPFRRAT